MAGSKEIRTKIKSVENTRKITKAMEMVAASKMRKAQDRMTAARPYAEKIKTISIFPISKSPIRTLPAKLVNNIIEYLIDKEFDIHLVLDNSSEISKPFEKEINNQFIKTITEYISCWN